MFLSLSPLASTSEQEIPWNCLMVGVPARGADCRKLAGLLPCPCLGKQLPVPDARAVLRVLPSHSLPSLARLTLVFPGLTFYCFRELQVLVRILPPPTWMLLMILTCSGLGMLAIPGNGSCYEQQGESLWRLPPCNQEEFRMWASSACSGNS